MAQKSATVLDECDLEQGNEEELGEGKEEGAAAGVDQGCGEVHEDERFKGYRVDGEGVGGQASAGIEVVFGAEVEA